MAGDLRDLNQDMKAKVEGQNSSTPPPHTSIKQTEAVYLGTFGNNDLSE